MSKSVRFDDDVSCYRLGEGGLWEVYANYLPDHPLADPLGRVHITPPLIVTDPELIDMLSDRLEKTGGSRESSVTNCPNCGGQLKNFIVTNDLSTGLPYGERVDRCQSCGTEWLIENEEISLYRSPDEVVAPPLPDPYDYDELKSYQEMLDEESHRLDDEMAVFGKVGSWEDVRDKAVRLRLEGAVNILRLDRDVVTATVQGDSGLYNVVLYRQDPTSLSISTWECDCGWGEWAFKRQHTYVGRMCSHAYATMLEAQSQLMTGGGLPWQLQYASKLAVSGSDLEAGDIVAFSAKQWFPENDAPIVARVDYVYPDKNFVDVIVNQDTEDENVYLVDCDLITHVNGNPVFTAHRALLARAVKNAESGDEVRKLYSEAKKEFLERLRTADKNDYCAYRESGQCKYPALRRVGEEWPEPIPADAWVTSEPGNTEYQLAYWDRGKCPYFIWPMQRKCEWSMPRADFKGASFTEGDSVSFEYDGKTLQGFLVENLGGDTATVRAEGGLFNVPYTSLDLQTTAEELLYTDELPLVEDTPDIPTDVELDTAPLLTRTTSRKRAALEFTATELYEIEEEGKDVVARNFHKLDLRGTHYEDLG